MDDLDYQLTKIYPNPTFVAHSRSKSVGMVVKGNLDTIMFQ
jgi:hypothetical protein